MRKDSPLYLTGVLIISLAAVVAIGFPVVHLTVMAVRDQSSLQPVPYGYADDASRLNSTRVQEVWPVPEAAQDAERQLIEVLARARQDKLKVSIAGARHSMGGHTIAVDGIVINMLPFRRMSLSDDGLLLTVQAGALWSDVIPFLDGHGRSVAIMQSDNSFSVGGTLSVNAHGWQAKRPPISSSVESFRLLMADGRILRCSREENAELFALALGGYGLFGIILDAELRTVANEWYEVTRHRVKTEQFADVFQQRVDGDADVEMAFGRLRVAQKSFLEDGILTIFRKANGRVDPLPPLAATTLDPLKRAIFRGSVGSDYGKRLRWNLESVFGEKVGGHMVSRNQLLHGDAALYANRTEGYTDIIHEYFLPPDQLSAFLAQAAEIIPRHALDLLNVTLRDVRKDEDTHLNYADRDLIAVVMLFSQIHTEAAERSMGEMTRELIDASALAGGRYYLPYRPHATLEQFLRAYPQAKDLVARKRAHDPDEIFSNQFYSRYLSHLVASAPADDSIEPSSAVQR